MVKKGRKRTKLIQPIKICVYCPDVVGEHDNWRFTMDRCGVCESVDAHTTCLEREDRIDSIESHLDCESVAEPKVSLARTVSLN